MPAREAERRCIRLDADGPRLAGEGAQTAAVAGGRRVGILGIESVIVTINGDIRLEVVAVAVLEEVVDALRAVDDAVVVENGGRVPRNEGGRTQTVLAVHGDDDV